MTDDTGIEDDIDARIQMPRAEGGDLPISRRCWGSRHAQCVGLWQFKFDTGPCECECHPSYPIGGIAPGSCLYCSALVDPDPFWYGTCGDPDCLAIYAYENGVLRR